MSDIKNIEEVRKLKEIRKKYQKERELIEIEIELLQKQLDTIDRYLEDDSKDTEWHEKPPLPTQEIQTIYKDFMENEYNPEDYKPKKD